MQQMQRTGEDVRAYPPEMSPMAHAITMTAKPKQSTTGTGPSVGQMSSSVPIAEPASAQREREQISAKRARSWRPRAGSEAKCALRPRKSSMNVPSASASTARYVSSVRSSPSPTSRCTNSARVGWRFTFTLQITANAAAS